MWLSSLSLRNRKSNEVKLTEHFFSSLVKVSSEMLVIVPVIDAIYSLLQNSRSFISKNL